jgi:hypothetical protein
MPTFTADQFIGKTLIAKKKVPIYNQVGGQPYKYANAGDYIGIIYSWVGGNNGQPLYWMMESNTGKNILVKHETGVFDVRTGDIKSLEQKDKEAATKDEIEQKGKFLYYFEKYGKTVLITIAAVMIVKEVIRSKAYQNKKYY